MTRMIPPLKTGAMLPRPNWPGIETERLILRQWRASDIAPNTAMLCDPISGRFITADGKPSPTDERLAQFRDHGGTLGAARLRHVRGRGKIVRNIRRPGRSVLSAGLARLRGRLGHRQGISRQGLCGRGGAGIDRLVVRDLRDSTRIIHCIDRENAPSQAVARRLGAANEGETMLLGMPADLWVTIARGVGRRN